MIAWSTISRNYTDRRGTVYVEVTCVRCGCVVDERYVDRHEAWHGE